MSSSRLQGAKALCLLEMGVHPKPYPQGTGRTGWGTAPSPVVPLPLLPTLHHRVAFIEFLEIGGSLAALQLDGTLLITHTIKCVPPVFVCLGPCASSP